MSPPDRPPPAPPQAMLLLRDTSGAVARWAGRGLLPMTLSSGLAWTVAVPAGTALTAPPYDDALAVFGGVPVPRRLRPAVCLVVSPDRLAVQVQGASWQASRRWLVWAKGIGLSRYDSLVAASPAGVARLLAPTNDGSARLIEALRRDGREPAAVGDDVLTALELPGVGILTGTVDVTALAGAVQVEPSIARLERFDDRARDEMRARADRGEGA